MQPFSNEVYENCLNYFTHNSWNQPEHKRCAHEIPFDILYEINEANMSIEQKNATVWDERSKRDGLHAVFTTRWSDNECLAVDTMQKELIFSFLPDLQDCCVLDLGCGIGRITSSLGEKAKNVVGVDISHHMLKRACLETRFESPISFVQASAAFMPFQDATFDVIVASYVLQHILDETSFSNSLREISRALKPGGSALLVDSLENHSYLPSNSSVTMIRTIDQYSEILKKTCRLLDLYQFRCVDDSYSLMLWKRVL